MRPLLFRPGLVTREYLSGHRIGHVPPLKTYLISALVFFGLFAAFPTRAQIDVFTTGEERPTGGSRMTFELPAHVPINDAKYQQLLARAKANPENFASAVGAAIPRAFFLFLPIFAGLLELFYRRQGYYVDHLVFSLYYHAFVFVVFSALFLMSRTDRLLPGDSESGDRFRATRLAGGVSSYCTAACLRRVAMDHVLQAGGAWRDVSRCLLGRLHGRHAHRLVDVLNGSA